MFKAYYQLTKPGIVYGNMLTAASGFLLAAAHERHFKLVAFVGLVIGLALVIASACVFNNYIDRDIDTVMPRTKQRALVTQVISNQQALVYATILVIVGAVLLGACTNTLTVVLGAIGFVVYVAAYGIFKRKTPHATLIGSISGAVPIVAGYTAMSNRIDTGAVSLGLILIFWQMPHFYAIALYRMNDYKAAKVPVMPLARGIENTRTQIVVYTALFVIASGSLGFTGYTGYTYLVIVGAVGLYWLWLGVQGFKNKDIVAWSRKMFFVSLIVMLTLSVALPIGALLA